MSLPTLQLRTLGWTLRAYRDSDAEDVALHANNPVVWRNMADTFPHPYTLDIARHWVSVGHISFGGDNWAIAFEDQAVGGCGIHACSGPLRCNAEIGYWLAQRHWGQGIATQVAQVLTERAFADPQITRVFAPVHSYNPASVRVLQHCGFEQEALQRLSAIKAGRVIDRIVMAHYRPGLAGAITALPTLPT